MSNTQKRRLLGLLLFACLLLVLLAVSLPALQMQPGEVFNFPLKIGGQPVTSGVHATEDFGAFIILIRVVMIGLIILLPVYILIGLLSKEGRQKLFSEVMTIVVLILIIFLIDSGSKSTGQPESTIIPESPSTALPTVALETVYTPVVETASTPWLMPVLIIISALLLGAVAFLTLRFLSRRRALDLSPYEEIAENAQTALDALQRTETDFEDIIIRCYAEMSLTIQTKLGIQRDRAMTTHEFEQELLARGFPAGAVSRLTQLFEQVRYGHRQMLEEEKQGASDSLREIIEFCRGLS